MDASLPPGVRLKAYPLRGLSTLRVPALSWGWNHGACVSPLYGTHHATMVRVCLLYMARTMQPWCVCVSSIWQARL
jgi:hypothetical protein